MESVKLKPYITVDHFSECEFTEKRSRFIGRCWHVETEEEAVSTIAMIKKKCWDATHNCYAYILRDGTARYTDDGEPAGTAGLPIVERMKRQDVTDALVIVTRYFGGTLLGTGGLVRAYARSAGDAITAAGLVRMTPCDCFSVKCSYPLFNTAKAVCIRYGRIETTVFLENVEIIVWVEQSCSDSFISTLTEESEGKIRAVFSRTDYFPFPLAEDVNAK